MPTETNIQTSEYKRALTDPVEMLDHDDPPNGLTWHQHVVQQLRRAASIEHALMVQYLFAAYSLGGKSVKTQQEKEEIAGWRDFILSIAKEEMGHLLTVQNILCLLGAEPEFGRQNDPPFKLERLTMESLTQYLWVEMPSGNLADLTEIKRILGDSFKRLEDKEANQQDAPRVGRLYRGMIKIIENPARIPDKAFNERSFRLQASWDDWGRGYNDKKPLPLLPLWLKAFEPILEFFSRFRKEPLRTDVLIERAATRDQAIDALSAVAEQGESSQKSDGSHLVRFAIIMKNFDLALKGNPDWDPTHRIAENPGTGAGAGSTITWPLSEKWANLFDLRYEMLLTYIGHTFKLAPDGNQARLRGAILHKAFGEMYNLKAIAGILVQLPLKDPDDPDRAGPPFRLPDTMSLPKESAEFWPLYARLIGKALQSYDDLIKETDTQRQAAKPGWELDFSAHEPYLRMMRKLDENSAAWIAGVMPKPRPDIAR